MAIHDRNLQVLIYICITLIWLGDMNARCVAESVINNGINCQNGGTQINKCTCVCPGGLFGRHCNHSMYLSFDTMENLTLMQGLKQSIFNGLVKGQVNSAMSLNAIHRQWIDLGFHPEVCLANKYGCSNEGASISLWLKIPDCNKSTMFINTLQDGIFGSGFTLHCFGGPQFGLLSRTEFISTTKLPINTADWIHVVFNFHGRNKVPGYSWYFDGERKTSETQKFHRRRTTKPPYRQVTDGRIAIGKYNIGPLIKYYTFVIDELLFFNHPVTEPEIKMLSIMI